MQLKEFIDYISKNPDAKQFVTEFLAEEVKTAASNNALANVAGVLDMMIKYPNSFKPSDTVGINFTVNVSIEKVLKYMEGKLAKQVS